MAGLVHVPSLYDFSALSFTAFCALQMHFPCLSEVGSFPVWDATLQPLPTSAHPILSHSVEVQEVLEEGERRAETA